MAIQTIFLVLLATLSAVSGMELRFSNRFSRMGRIGSGKDITASDKIRAKALGPNVCVERIPIGFQTSCVMINYRHNCTMTSHYRSVFYCCPGFTAVLKKSGCPLELYVTNMTLVQELQSLGLNTLAALIEQAGLIKALTGSAKFTILAPNERAFKNLDKRTLKKLMADKKALSKVLLYHVIKGKVPCSALKDNELVDMMDGGKVRVNLFFNDRFITFNGAPVRSANRGASNGIIHVIDRVLLPPNLAGEKILAGLNDVSLFRKALAMNNITISDGQTILAPLNKAFNKIDPTIFERLLKSPKCFKNLLLNHILPRPVFTTTLDDNESLGLRTKEGTAYFLKKRNGTTMVGDATINMADLLATDSVIHVIDKVLVPTSALTVLEIAKQRGAHLFYRLVKETGVRSLLKESGKYTLFAPADNALKKFVGNTSFSVLSKISDVIKYHIVPRSIQTCDFKNDLLLDTLDGKNKIRINVYDYGLNNAVQGVCLSSSKCNVEACNGAVHIISEVLKPATDTLTDVITTDKRFTAFAAALQKAKLESMLKGEKPFTIFAPTNSAFSKMKPKELEDLLANGQRLRGLLKYHIAHGTYFRCAFGRDCPIVSISGRSILIKMLNNAISVNDAQLSGKEIVTSNGIIYPIDCVLSPKYRRSLFSDLWQMFGF